MNGAHKTKLGVKCTFMFTGQLWIHWMTCSHRPLAPNIYPPPPFFCFQTCQVVTPWNLVLRTRHILLCFFQSLSGRISQKEAVGNLWWQEHPLVPNVPKMPPYQSACSCSVFHVCLIRLIQSLLMPKANLTKPRKRLNTELYNET